MNKFVQILVAFALATASVFAGAAQAKGKYIIYGKINFPTGVKHDLVVESYETIGNKVSMADFKKIASSWSAGDVHLNTARMCQIDRASTANIAPYEHILVYSVRKGGKEYYTEVDLGVEARKITEDKIGNVSDLHKCRFDFEKKQIVVLRLYIPPKGSEH